MWIWLKRIVLAVLVFAAVAQVIRPARTNPPIDPMREIHAALPVDSSVSAILARSCNDCHSNRTVWPWYSQVAPVSWLVAYDVRQGRSKLNFSEWDSHGAEANQKLLEEICSEVRDGEMPGWQYSLLHPESKLSLADTETVCGWTRTAGGARAAR